MWPPARLQRRMTSKAQGSRVAVPWTEHGRHGLLVKCHVFPPALPSTLALARLAFLCQSLFGAGANRCVVPDLPAETCRPSGSKAGLLPSLRPAALTNPRLHFPVMEGCLQLASPHGRLLLARLTDRSGRSKPRLTASQGGMVLSPCGRICCSPMLYDARFSEPLRTTEQTSGLLSGQPLSSRVPA